MSNLVKNVSYSNTFGEWVVTTNDLVIENNTLAKLNYTKDTGTLYLNDPTLGLQVANNAIVAGALQVQGVGSFGYIQNNLRVDKQVFFTNTILGLTNSGQANIEGPLFAEASGTGLYVSNNSTIGGNLSILGSGTGLYVSNNSTIGGNLSILGSETGLYVQNNATIEANTFLNIVQVKNFILTNNLTSNVIISTASLNVSGKTFTDLLQANTNVNTPSVTSSNVTNTGTIITDYLQANTKVNTLLVTTENILATTLIDATTATGTFDVISSNNITSNNVSVGLGGLEVIGDFIVKGTTILDTNKIVINSADPAMTSGEFATFEVARGASGANAAIRWNESQKYWETLNVFNNQYNKLISNNSITQSLSNNFIDVIPSAFVTNTLNTYAQSAYLQANNVTTWLSTNNSLQSGINSTQNTNITNLNTWLSTNNSLQSGINSTQNTRISVIEGVDVTQNTNISNLTTWLSTNNSLQSGINSSQNTRITIVEDVNDTQNTNITNLTTWLSTNNSLQSGINSSQNTSITNLTTWLSTNNSLQSGINSTQNTNITAVNTYAGTAYARANTSANSFTGTSGSATPSLGVITITSGNGVTVSGTGSTLTINTPQSVQTSASPSFTGLSVTNKITGSISGNCDGNSGTVTNGVYTTGSYSNPTWITALAGSKISGNITGFANNITAYIINQGVGTANNVQFNSLGVGTAASAVAGEIRATNDVTAYYSDDKLKTKLGNIESALDKILTLNGFYYEANETAQNLGYQVKREVGVSAQEVQKVLPEIVVPAPIDDQYLTVKYERIIPLIIEAIKDLKTEIDILKNNSN